MKNYTSKVFIFSSQFECMTNAKYYLCFGKKVKFNAA